MSSLHCENISYTPATDASPVFSGFSLTLDTREITVMTGDSGTGKTTLGLLLAGGIVPQNGKIFLNGQLLDNAQLKPGFLDQNPENQIFGTTVERDIAYGLENQGIPREHMQSKIEIALDIFDLASIRKQPVDALSGGEKQRTALAGLFVMEHPYFILDEPTSFLDYPSQKILSRMLRRLRNEGKGLLWITQYPEESVLGQRVIELGDNDILQDRKSKSYPIDEGLYKFSIPDNCKEAGEPLISAEGLSFQYPQWENTKSFRLEIQKFSLKSGERQGWFGYSGSGKSTFAKLLTGILKPSDGQLSSVLSPGELVYVPQFAERMLYSGTLSQTVELFTRHDNFDRQKYRIRLEHYFTLMGISPEEPFRRPVWSFSGGEQRRIVLAVACALNPAVLILDEPTIGISPADRKKLVRVFQSEDVSALICISHEYQLLKRVTHHGFFFNYGKVHGPDTWANLEEYFHSCDPEIIYEKPLEIPIGSLPV